jgi:hypothetical protein
MDKVNNELMTYAFFGNVKAAPKGTTFCCNGGCGKRIKKPANGGYTPFTSHIQFIHNETMMDVYNEYVRLKPKVIGPMDTFNPVRYVSRMAKKVIQIFVNLKS